MVLIDTHAHLCDARFEEDRFDVLRRAKEKGVEKIIEIADSPGMWENAKKLAKNDRPPEFPHLFWACGFHPHYAEESAAFDFGLIKGIASDPDCVAIGEIGLDYVRSRSTKENQKKLFIKMLEIAAELEKPLIIHCREAEADTLEILKNIPGSAGRKNLCAGVMHCFSGDAKFAEDCLELGFMLGVDGPLTYPGAKTLREAIRKAPLERILLETDSPYLPPQNFRGERNEPSYLVWTAEKVAELFNEKIEKVAEVTTRNAMQLFQMKEGSGE